jgi:hypothetical protein
MTAPYLPSQNGVAERMNQTLVELARAMITARELPEFLWEAATAHAAYLRNRSFSSSVATVKTSTFEKCVITGAINYVKS